MKTRAKLFKLVFLMLVTSAFMVSCGKNNKSGGSSTATTPVCDASDPYCIPGGSYGGIDTAGYGSFSQNLSVVAQENPCRVANQMTNERVKVTIPLVGVNVNTGSMYVGVTPEGDIGVVGNINGVPAMDLHLCPRPDLTGQGNLLGSPVLNTSQLCPIGEVTAANVALMSNSGYGDYILQFAPIHVPGTDRYSSLCR